MYKFTRWVPQDRSGKVCWLLNELGVPYEVQDLEHKIHHNDVEYRKLHPLGFVPVLQDLRSKTNLFETGAICLYLAEKHPDRNFLPEAKKAACYQWLMYNYATLEPAIEPYWNIDADDPEVESKKAAIDVNLEKLLKPIEDTLAQSDYIAGDQFTVADIPVSQTIYWLRRRPVLALFPKTRSYLERMKLRPAAVKSEIFTDV